MRAQAIMASAGIAVALAIGASLALAQSHAGTTQQHRAVLPDKLSWGPPPPGLPPALQAAVVDGDPTKPGFFVVRLRGTDGTVVRPHWHSQDEHLTVLSGKVEMSMGDQMGINVTPGGMGAYFLMPGGQRHSATLRGDTIVQLDGLGPFDIFYVNPNDDPRLKRSSR
jgi:quercetin dioxygenase-like cupin family protein